MKKITLILFAVLSVSLSYGQDSTNFSVVDNGLVWQKVYNTTLTFKQLAEQVKLSGVFESDKLTIVENSLYGELKRMKMDYKGAGYTKTGAPAFILSNEYSGFAAIDFKDNRYRVTFKKILMSGQINGNNYEKNFPIESQFVREGMIRSYLNKGAIKVLNYNFTKAFDFKEAAKW